jgi:hypothetical protein
MTQRSKPLPWLTTLAMSAISLSSWAQSSISQVHASYQLQANQAPYSLFLIEPAPRHANDIPDVGRMSPSQDGITYHGLAESDAGRIEGHSGAGWATLDGALFTNGSSMVGGVQLYSELGNLSIDPYTALTITADISASLQLGERGVLPGGTWSGSDKLSASAHFHVNGAEAPSSPDQDFSLASPNFTQAHLAWQASEHGQITLRWVNPTPFGRGSTLFLSMGVSGTSMQSQTVPETSTTLMLMVGSGAMTWMLRRQRS